MQARGRIDIVYSAAEDSDFLVYGMRDILHNLKLDGTCHPIKVHEQVLGRAVGCYQFKDWGLSQFQVWSAAGG